MTYTDVYDTRALLVATPGPNAYHQRRLTTLDERPMRPALLLLLLLSSPTTALAHGVPDMCDTRQDIVSQCGEFHSCATRTEVSDDIGVCEGEFEEERFSTCDRRRGDEDCGEGLVCRIGALDPNIGACIERPPISYLDSEPEAPAMEEDPEASGCTHAPTPRAPAWGSLLLVLGVWLGRRRR